MFFAAARQGRHLLLLLESLETATTTRCTRRFRPLVCISNRSFSASSFGNKDDKNDGEHEQQRTLLPTRRSGRRKRDNRNLHPKESSASSLLSAATASPLQPRTTTLHHPSYEDDTSIGSKKRLDVAIVGLPNAGKSQLLNVLTESPVAAVSRKRHTTRHGGILGARTVTVSGSPDNDKQELEGGALALALAQAPSHKSPATTTSTTTHQLVFVDTPGFMKVSQAKKEGLDGSLVSTAAAVMQNVDYTLLVVDAAVKLSDSDSRREAIVALMLQALQSEGRKEGQENRDVDDKHSSKYAIVLNKVDLVRPKTKLLDIAMDISSMAKECLKYHHYISGLRMDHHDDDGNDYRRTSLPMSTRRKIRDISKIRENTPFDDEESYDGNDDDDEDDSFDEEEMPTFFYTSALHEGDEGVKDLLQHLLNLSTPTFEDFPVEPGHATQLDDLDRVEEIIREKIYRCLHKEVPYAVEQENRLYEKRYIRATPSATSTNTGVIPVLVIHQDLRVRTKSHRNIGQQNLQRIRETATRDLERIFSCKVHLHLNVKLVKSKNYNR